MPADLREGLAPSPAAVDAVPAPRRDAEGTSSAVPAVARVLVAPQPADRQAVAPEAPRSPTELPRAVAALAVVPTALVLLVVGDAGGALAPSAWTPALLPTALLRLPGGPVLVSLLALAVLGATAAWGVGALRRRSDPGTDPGTGAGSRRAAALTLLLVAPLLGEAVVDPVLAAAAGSVVLAGGCCARAVRRRAPAATRTAAAAVALVALVLPVQAWWTTLSTSPSSAVLPWLVAGSALLVPVVHGRARLVLAATSASAGVAALVGAAGL